MIEATAAWLAHDHDDRRRCEHADRPENDKGVAPAIDGSDRGAECDTQRCPDRGAEIVDAERRAAAAGGKIVGDDRVGRRDTAGLTEAYGHPRGGKLGVGHGKAAGHRRTAPDRAGERQHPDPVGLVGDPAHGNGDEGIEYPEIEPADQAELAVGDVQAVLYRFGEDREELPVEEIQHIDEAQHPEHNPGALAGDCRQGTGCDGNLGRCRRRLRFHRSAPLLGGGWGKGGSMRRTGQRRSGHDGHRLHRRSPQGRYCYIALLGTMRPRRQPCQFHYCVNEYLDPRIHSWGTGAATPTLKNHCWLPARRRCDTTSSFSRYMPG